MSRIDFKPYALPLKLTYRYAKGEYEKREGLIVRVEIDGYTGWGEVSPALYRRFDVRAYLGRAEEMVEGLDVADDKFLPKLDEHLRKLDERFPQSPLRCGIATAWLSARAAAEGMSLSRYLGKSEHIPAEYVPINGLIVDKTIEGAVEQARGYIETGIRTLKIKCFNYFARDFTRVDEIRKAFPNAILRLDPNEAWTEEVALDYLKKLAQFDIEYVEDALPQDRPLKKFADLRAKSPINWHGTNLLVISRP